MDNYDTLITKAALHGAKLLKKSHQATAVGLASHLWWQEAVPVETDAEPESGEKKEVDNNASAKVDGETTVKAVRVCHFLLTVDFNLEVGIVSTPTRIASAFWSAYKSH